MTDSPLKQQLRDDLTTAMKARDQLKSATLRMVLTAVSNEEVAGKEARDLDDSEVLKILTKEAKKRREAAEAYVDAKRPELAQKEEDELAVIAEYLPAQLSAEELQGIIKASIDEVKADGMQAMGQVMKLVQPKVAGRADGKTVADEVRRLLS